MVLLWQSIYKEGELGEDVFYPATLSGLCAFPLCPSGTHMCALQGPARCDEDPVVSLSSF